MYLPAGQHLSRWAGSDEFEEIIESISDPDRAFGTHGPTGLTLESSFGSGSALLQLLPSLSVLARGLLKSFKHERNVAKFGRAVPA